MKPRRALAALAGVAVGGISLITTATCDPVSGGFDFFRDDDFDDCCYEDVYVDYYYEDCYFWGCY